MQNDMKMTNKHCRWSAKTWTFHSDSQAKFVLG